jgi:hypothetical protein
MERNTGTKRWRTEDLFRTIPPPRIIAAEGIDFSQACPALL